MVEGLLLFHTRALLPFKLCGKTWIRTCSLQLKTRFFAPASTTLILG